MKRKITIKKKRIEVHWYDHCSYRGWVDFDNANDWCKEEAIINCTVGWLWYENAKTLVVAQTISQCQVSELQKIIKQDICFRKILKS